MPAVGAWADSDTARRKAEEQTRNREHTLHNGLLKLAMFTGG